MEVEPVLLVVSAFATTSVAFALFVQFSPQMGNIWIRRDSTGTRRLIPGNLFRLMAEPFKITSAFGQNFWSRPALWPINYPLWVVAAAAASTLLYWLLVCLYDSNSATTLESTASMLPSLSAPPVMTDTPKTG